MKIDNAETCLHGEILDRKRAIMLRNVETDAKSMSGLFRRVYDGTASPRQCIKAKCVECCGFDRKAITECTATECPLHGLRPFQAKVAS